MPPRLRGVLLLVVCLAAGCTSRSEPADSGGTAVAPLPTAARIPDRSVLPAPTPQTTVATGPTVGGPMRGVTVVLDAGHNGRNAEHPERLAALVPAGGFTKACNTVGASTGSGYPEHAYAMDVVQRATVLLRARGATVVLTRQDDDGFGPCVDARAAVGNTARADAVVSVHADGAPVADRGFHVIAPALAPDGGNAAVLEPSYRLAQVLRDEFRSTGMPVATYTAVDGLVQRRDLAGLNLSRVPVVLLESGNMRNAEDAATLSSSAWRDRAAAAVVTAVETFVTGR